MGLWGIEGWYWFPHGDFWNKIFFHFFFSSLFFPGIPFLRSFFFLVTSLVRHPFPDRFYFTSIPLSHRSPSSRSDTHTCLMQMYDKCIARSFIRLLYKASRNNSKRTMGLRRIVHACVCVSRFLYQSAFINYKCTIRLKQNRVQRDICQQ